MNQCGEEDYEETALRKKLLMATFINRFKKATFRMSNLISNQRRFFSHFVFVGFFLIEDYEQCALQKELIVAIFEDWFKAATFRKSQLISLISAQSKLLKNFIFDYFLLIEDYEQGALQKDSVITPFKERFQTPTSLTHDKMLIVDRIMSIFS